MIQEPELEEGEACYYKDDTTTDPDIALSYIGDKVQSILGHLHKDFEGGVSAENLGSKFGGYGSFLPMYQRSPSNWSQPKSPHKVQNPSFFTSPNHSFPEKNNSKDGSIRQNGPLHNKVELPSNKSGNKTQQRTFKVRIKVGPERMEQYNAEIHNLGLTSPSSSAGNSPLVSPSESPADILQIMTSFPVPGGLLLSPLCEDLLNLTREIESSLENKNEAACKSSAISVRLLSNDVHGGKKAKPVDKSGTFYKSETGSTVDVNNRKQNGKKCVQRMHLSKKSLVDTSLEHNENPRRLLEGPSGDRPKNSNNDTAKTKLSYGDKLKGKSSNKKYFDKMTHETYFDNEGVVNGLEQPMVAPLVIQEDWVGCDRCEKWRLLPFGTKSEQLPEKWVCSMLDWLPGMNRCDVSEDDTSAAVRASHPGTIPEKQNNFQAPDDKLMSGLSLAGAHHFDHNNQNFASTHIADQVKKQKLKEKVNMVRMSNPISSSDSKKDLQRRAVKYGSSKEVNQSIAEVHSTVKFNAQHPHKSAVVEKLKKRKNENVIGDDAYLRKKSKKEFERVHGKVEKNTSEAAPDADKFDNFGVNLVRNGHSLTDKESVKGGKKQSTQKDRISAQIHLNEQKGLMHDLPDHQPTSKEVPAKKRKLKGNNGSNLQERKYYMKDESNNSAFHRDKKSRVTHIEEEFKRRNGDDIKRTVKANLTIEDIDKLRKDLGFEQVSTAATSSSSKVSDSRKNRISHMEMKGSPQESVSSSPARISEAVRNPVRDFRKNDLKDKSCDLPSNFRNSPLVGNVQEKCSQSPGRVILVNRNHNEGMSKEHSNTNSRKKSSFRSTDKNISSTQRERGRNDVKLSTDVQQKLNKNFVGSSVEQVSSKVEPWSVKLRINLRQGDKQGKYVSEPLESLKRSSMNSRPVEDSVNGGTASRKAEDTLKEAEELRVHADLIKNSGFGSESNYEYFKAAIKFLQGASLLEACNGESSKYLEMKPLQLYGTAAKFCKTCAHEYEKSREMAATALAYKCMEVAYMRVVYCKSSSTHRVWQDLQSSLQMAPLGESPSSSASDVDNLNYLPTADKATLSKDNGSNAGNHVIVPHNVPNFVRLLDFTKDVSLAMEAAKKSQDALAAAHIKLEESQNKEGIISVKRVIDFSFQDVDELIRLVWIAFNTINRQGLSGSKEH